MINSEKNRNFFTKGYQDALADVAGHARSLAVRDTLSETYNRGYTQGKLDAQKAEPNVEIAWKNAIKENSYSDKEIPKEIAFFTCDAAEDHLIYTEPDEAIKTFLDGFIETNTPGIAGLPKTITLYGFEPMKVRPSGYSPLIYLLDDLDAEYGNPEGGSTVAAEKMKVAEKDFIAAVVAEYHPWAHELTRECTVDVEAWVIKNMPEWLE